MPECLLVFGPKTISVSREIIMTDSHMVVCPDKVSDAEGLSGIAEIAEWERWTFEYLPDGGVRFTSL
jgi:hypothetical protein